MIGSACLYLSLFERYIARASACLSDVDAFNRPMYVDGTFNVLRFTISKGGIIFTDAQSFQYIVNLNAFKCKVIGVTKVFHLRLRTFFVNIPRGG
ncbi:MAG: hypothetical protein ACTS4T_01950 [Candidatus Hodgkinia cicadicola]